MSKDRRQHKRIPLTLSVAKPIRIEMHTDQYDGTVPGILVNLSANGIGMIVFHKLPTDSKVEFDLDFIGIDEKVKGKIVREEKKFNETFMVGIQFTDVSKELEEIIACMAEDHDICEVRYVMDPETSCFPECSFHKLCGKRVKKDF